MASAGQWFQGARPRTLPAAVAPVLAGTGAAFGVGGGVWGRAGLALLVAVALQVAVNFANDYSDGVRGTDADRVGPLRLVGSGAAPAGAVKGAAFAAFGVASVAGVALVAWSGLWWLLGVGVAAVAAAWLYTGGPQPYGYMGLGEVFVFVFFGLVAVAGTTVTQAGQVDTATWLAAVGVGAISCAVLVANNVRDIPGDTVAGKRTLAVRLGQKPSRLFFVALLVVPLLLSVVMAAVTGSWWPLVGVAAGVAAVKPSRVMLGGAEGPDLIPVLSSTGVMLLVYGALTGLGLWLAGQ